MMTNIRINKFFMMQWNRILKRQIDWYPLHRAAEAMGQRSGWRQAANRAWPAENCQMRVFMEIVRACEIKLAAMLTIR